MAPTHHVTFTIFLDYWTIPLQTYLMDEQMKRTSKQEKFIFPWLGKLPEFYLFPIYLNIYLACPNIVKMFSSRRISLPRNLPDTEVPTIGSVVHCIVINNGMRSSHLSIVFECKSHGQWAMAVDSSLLIFQSGSMEEHDIFLHRGFPSTYCCRGIFNPQYVFFSGCIHQLFLPEVLVLAQ